MTRSCSRQWQCPEGPSSKGTLRRARGSEPAPPRQPPGASKACPFTAGSNQLACTSGVTTGRARKGHWCSGPVVLHLVTYGPDSNLPHLSQLVKEHQRAAVRMGPNTFQKKLSQVQRVCPIP